MMKKLPIFALVLISLASCVSNRTALNVAHRNGINITDVKLGMTPSEVIKIMKHEAESRDVKTLADGATEESWNYLTDYNNDTNTTLIFRTGRLSEMNHTKWLGNGTFHLW